ncbi:glycosyltransferase family 4 protein [Streptomyces sp. NPDC048297]|uniref:glycosyltransferase family 4 protein n=1 Tax=Streptomyces sp. NPDC048297 TaxID=3365531 RepID=UPI00371F5C91
MCTFRSPKRAAASCSIHSAKHALRHAEMLKVLPKIKVLCVSTARADMFRQLGVSDPVVVYNTVPLDTHRARARQTPGERPRIVMVGSMQDRKGLDLFSRVAELAYARGLPWRFAWIGHKTWRIGASTLLSDRVEWMGALSRDRVREELAASDVFFPSSVDDPMPLSVVEAVQQRLRTVTYHRVGSREVSRACPGTARSPSTHRRQRWTRCVMCSTKRSRRPSTGTWRSCSTSPPSPPG